MPEFSPEILAGIAAILTALGGLAAWRNRGNSVAPEDKIKQALDANTAALGAMLEQFRANNSMFAGLAPRFDTLIEVSRESRRVQHEIHTEIVRLGK